MSEKKPVERVRGFKTASQVADLITGPWRDASIAIARQADGKLLSVKRVSFHENDSGRLVVVVHDCETPLYKSNLETGSM
jgi:hypothetical protein